MNNRQKINKRIDNIVSSLSNPTDDFPLAEVIRQLADFYLKNPDPRTCYETAKNDVEKWDEARRPKNDGQSCLFDEDAVIPTGKNTGSRVFMKYAKRRDLVGWRVIEIKTFKARSTDHVGKITYIDSRLEVWDESIYKTLGDLERGEFSGKGKAVA